MAMVDVKITIDFIIGFKTTHNTHI